MKVAKVSRLTAACILSAALTSTGALHAREQGAPNVVRSAPAQYVDGRVLPLEGGQNFRDLGGYTTENNRHIRWGMLFRSGSMFRLTSSDFSYLRKIGLKTVVDFRSKQERDAEPVNWPSKGRPSIVADDYDFSTLGQHMTDLQTMKPEELQVRMVQMYPIILDQFNSQYRRLFDQLLSGGAPLSFNCSAGRDRTGVAAALVLTALGVPRETVIQDYLLTNRYFQLARTGPAAQTWGNIPASTAAVMESSARPSIEAIFSVIDRHPGGASGYLRDKMGLDRTKIARLRDLYTQ